MSITEREGEGESIEQEAARRMMAPGMIAKERHNRRARAALAKKGIIDPDRWYRAREAAVVIHGTERGLQHMRSNGGGPAYTHSGKIILYRGSWLIEWLEQGRTTSTSAERAAAAE